MRFNVQWKAKGKAAAPLKLRVELRGVAHGDYPKQMVLEQPVEPGGWFSRWAQINLLGEEYKNFGRVTAWRVTLWEGAPAPRGAEVVPLVSRRASPRRAVGPRRGFSRSGFPACAGPFRSIPGLR